MFRTTLRFLSLIVLPHPELPTQIPRPIYHPHTATGDLSNVASSIHVFPREEYAIPPTRKNSGAFTSTPRKPSRPKSLDATAISAYNTTVSWRRNTLCICPEHCPPQNSSPTDTFFTCPPFPDSAVSSLGGCSNLHSFSRRRLSIHMGSAPPSPSPLPRSCPSHQVLLSPAHFSSTVSPQTDASMGSIDDVASSSSLVPHRSLRRSTQTVIPNLPSVEITPARKNCSSEPCAPPLAASSPLQKGPNNRRRSDVNSQTNSRLFELELSPILEDVHAVDRHSGSAASAEDGRAGLTQEYDSETSDSSLGSLLDVQCLGSVRIPVLMTAQTPPHSDIRASAERRESENRSCVPALTFTSPTPETLQSGVFCDMYSPGAQQDQWRSRPLSLESSRVPGDAPCQPRRDRAQINDRSFLSVPLKNEGIDSVRQRKEPKTPRAKLRIWTRAWKRLSHLPQMTLMSGAGTGPSGSSRRRQTKDVEARNSGTSTPFGDNGYAPDAELGNVEEYGFHSTGIGSRRRPSFGIQTLARRRLAKRHDPSKRYSIAF